MLRHRQSKTRLGALKAALSDMLKASSLLVVAMPALVLTGVASANTPFTTNTNVQVGSDGAAKVGIPIQVPPGTNGVQPSLSLSYSSNRGNGMVGMGWAISGLSQISRCSSTIAQDGVRKAVQYDSNDKFCLDGKRLKVASGTYGANDAEYRTELADFSKVISTTSNINNGPDKFTVYTKDGKVIEYGNTADAKVEVATPGDTSNAKRNIVRVWAVSKISDAHGNYIKFTYTEDRDQGEVYINKIEYTGNSDANVSPFASIEFSYEDRTDKTGSHFQGGTIKRSKRLKAIETKNENQLVKSYNLTYEVSENTGYSHVKTIKECDKASNCLKPLTFTWTAESNFLDGYQVNEGTVFPELINQAGTSVYPGDYNGDGRTDFLLKNAGFADTVVYFANADDSWSVTIAPVMVGTSNVSIAWINQAASNLITGDFNGDGRTDFIVTNPGFGSLPTFFSNGDGTWDTVNTTVIDSNDFNYSGHFINPTDSDVFTGDFNGDGRTDLFVRSLTYASNPLLLSKGDGTWEPYNPVITDSNGTNFSQHIINIASSELLLGEFNGDGRTDILIKNAGFTSTPIIYSNGDGTWEATNPTILDGDSNLSQLYINKQNTNLVAGDYNGDALTDFIVQHQDGEVTLTTPTFYAKGDGTWEFYNPQLWEGVVNLNQLIINRADTTIYPGDYNGDGRTDLMMSNTYSSGSQILFSKDNGEWLITNSSINNSDDGTNFSQNVLNKQNNTLYIGDFNGDGRSDFLVKKFNADNTPADTSPILLSQGTPPNLLSSIDFGFSRTAEFTYEPLTADTGTYTKGTSAVYPEVDLQIPAYVVSQSKHSNGIGGKLTKTYEYTGLKQDRNGRGLLGFATRKVIAEEDDVERRITHRQDFPYIGLASKTESYLHNSQTQIGETTNTFEKVSLTAGTATSQFPRLKKSVQKQYEIDGTLYNTVTKTNSSYDAFGNVTKSIVETTDGHKTTATSQFYNSPSSYNTTSSSRWVIGRLLRTDIKKENQTTVTAITLPTSAPADVSAIDTSDITEATAYHELPIVNMIAPANNTSYNNNDIVTLQASAFDNDTNNTNIAGGIAKVEFWVNDQLVNSDTQSPYSYNWQAYSGNHEIRARAFDVNGAVQTSFPVNVSVSVTSGSNQIPTAAPTATVMVNDGSASSATVAAGDSVMLAATVAANNNTISEVEFLVGGTSVGSAPQPTTGTTNEYRIAWDTTTADIGTHTVNAKVHYGLSETVTVAAQSITVEDGTNGNGNNTGDIVLLSQGKPTEQSSEWSGLPMSVASELAVDGDHNTQLQWNNTNSVTHTANEANAWWQVDLGQVASIDRVKVWNRSDHSDPLSNVYIFVSETDMRGRSYADIVADSSIKQHYHAGQMGVAPDYTQEVNMDGFAGRYVRIQLAGTNQLTLAEVEVYGSTGGSSSGGSTPSNTSPTVSVTASNTSPAVDDVVTLTATAADSDGSISQVEFLVDNVLVNTDTAAPYSYNWTATEGTHSIIAKATDNANAVVSSSAVSVTVAASGNNNNSGTVELISQGKPATQSTTLTGYGVTPSADKAVDGNTSGIWTGNDATQSMTHTASDTENEPWWQVDLGQSSSIERVKVWNRTDCCSDRLQYFYIFVSDNDMTGKSVQQLLSDSTVNAEHVNESLYNVESKEVTFTNAQGRYIKIQRAGTGILTLAEVEVHGIAGGSSNSGSGDTTPPANQAPSVSIETPADGSSSVEGNPITITAVAGDNDGTVASVSFYNGTQLLGSASTAPYSFTWNNAPVGTHTITAVATDDAGATTTSSAHSINVTADTSNNSGSGTTLYSEDFSGSTHSLTVWGGVQVSGLGTSTGKVLLENFNQASQNWPGYRSTQTFDYVVGQVFRSEVTTGGLSGLDGKVFIEGQQTDGSSVQLRANFGQGGFSYHFVDDGNWNYGGGTGTAIKANTTYIVEIEMKANGPALYVYEQGSSRASSTLTYEVTNGAWSNYQLRGEGYQGPSVSGTTQLSIDNLTVTQP